MGFKVGDRVRLAIPASGLINLKVGTTGTVTAEDEGVLGRYLVEWDSGNRYLMAESELASHRDLVEAPVDVSAPSVEDELADQFQRARDSWNSTVKLFLNGYELKGRRHHSRRELLIADLLVDAHTTDDVLTILSEFRLI